MRAITPGEVVGVFRKCRRCLVWRSMGNFNRMVYAGRVYRSRACNRCRKHFRKGEGVSGLYRITESGRAALHADGRSGLLHVLRAVAALREADVQSENQRQGTAALTAPGPAAQEP